MDKSNKGLWVGILVVLIIAIGALLSANRSIVINLPSGQSISPLGAITGETNLNVLGISGLKVGPTCNDSFGSSACDTQAAQLGGTCTAVKKVVSTLAASTSEQFYCAVTGARSGDAVIVQLPIGAASTTDVAGSLYGGFTVNGANATSSDFIQFSIFNGTGAATSSFPQATTSVNYWITR